MNNFSKDKIQFVKNKIREELKYINQKDKILYPEDAEILGTFFKKILSEINTTN
jgi:hypothetical protein